MKADAAAPRYLTASPRSRAADAREEGLALVSRANRWVVSGAVVLAGGVTAIAAHSFHAHTASPAPATSSASPSGVVPSQAAPGQGGGLQGPSQAPQSAPAPAFSAPAPVVSGGS